MRRRVDQDPNGDPASHARRTVPAGRFLRTLCALLSASLTLALLPVAHAGGPRWVAGPTYFNPAANGQPLHWSQGLITYYTDQGPLSSSIDNATANALVAAAAGTWNGIPTAAATLSAAGTLNEDVSGSNVVPASGLRPASFPSDVESTAKPVAVIYDADGAVIDALLGAGASDPLACEDTGAIPMVDNMAADGTLRHAMILLNGRCTGTPAQTAILIFQLTRAFGQVLGLDWSQANEQVFIGDYADVDDALAGWPIMHPNTQRCDTSDGVCMPDQTMLRFDDVAAISRLYPVTAANIGQFPGKLLTAAATVSIHGTISFSNGQGMEGVNVVARPLLPGSDTPDWRYSVSAVSGALFHGQNVNPVNGTMDSHGNPLNKFGSADPALEGAFDLGAIPLPPGQTQADYQITFEPINSLDSQGESVGPYVVGNPAPSGTMPTLIVRGLSAGSSVEQNVTIQDSAATASRDSAGATGEYGEATAPAALPRNGEWIGHLSGYGHSDWFAWPVAANREFTVEAMATDEQGLPTENKALMVLGIWDEFDAADSLPVVGTSEALNNIAIIGGTSLRISTDSPGQLRLGLADQRGDGRPDYAYRGRVLYAATVTPARLPASGGPFTVRGMGFRNGNTVSVNGVSAQVTSIEPTEITALAPAAAGATGTVAVEVDDASTLGAALIYDGLSYDAADGDILKLLIAPQGTVPMDVPMQFSVQALGANGTAAAGVTVTYSITLGHAVLGCGSTICKVIAGGDGSATLTVTANSTATTTVVASLANGASVQAQFNGGIAPAIAAISTTLYLAQGATYLWTPQVIVLKSGVPVAGKSVLWSAAAGVRTPTAATPTNAQGIAQASVTAGPLPPVVTVAVNACIAATSSCAHLTVASVNPDLASLQPVSGVGQTMPISDTPAPVVIRVVDNGGHPMAGGRVTFYESLDAWTPLCPVQGSCATAEVLAKAAVTAVSGADGLVTLTPLTRRGVPTRLLVTAVTGGWDALNFQIEQHP